MFFHFIKDYAVMPKSKTVVIYGQRLGSTILNSLAMNYPHAIHPPKEKTFDHFLELMEDHDVAIIVRDPISKIKSGLSVVSPIINSRPGIFEGVSNVIHQETLLRDGMITFKTEIEKEITESKWHVKKSGLINYSLGDSHIDWCTEVMFYYILSFGKMPKVYWLQGWEANSVRSINLPNMISFADDYFKDFPEPHTKLVMGYKNNGEAPSVSNDMESAFRYMIYNQMFSNASPHRIIPNKSRNNYVHNDCYLNNNPQNLIPRNPTEEFLTKDDIKFYSYHDYMSDYYVMFNTMITIAQDIAFYNNRHDRYDSDRCKAIAKDMITQIYHNMSTKMDLEWIKQNYWKPAPGQHFLNMIEAFKHKSEHFPQYEFGKCK